MAQHPGKLAPGLAVGVTSLVRRFGARTILDNVHLEIPQGEFVALLGRSGSGKSTFLRALAGLDHEADGTGTLQVSKKLSVVFQDARLLPWKHVVDNVMFGLRGGNPLEQAVHALAEVGLAGRERAWPSELSGGEQQRVALARALVRQPELLLADEPFGALDALTRLRMHDLLRQLCDRHQPAVVLVTHDVDEAIHLAERILILDQGRLSVDLRVDLPVHATARGTRIAEIREYLLARLGVREEVDQRPALQAGFA